MDVEMEMEMWVLWPPTDPKTVSQFNELQFISIHILVGACGLGAWHVDHFVLMEARWMLLLNKGRI